MVCNLSYVAIFGLQVLLLRIFMFIFIRDIGMWIIFLILFFWLGNRVVLSSRIIDIHFTELFLLGNNHVSSSVSRRIDVIFLNFC